MHWLLPDFRSEIATDSYRTGPRGKKAIFLMANSLDYGVSRNFDSLSTLLQRYEGFEHEAVLLLLGPARTPSPAEWDAIATFVASGGAIIFSPSSDEPDFDAKPFSVSGKELDRVLDLDGKTPIQVELGGLQGTFSWRSSGELSAGDNAAALVKADGTTQAVAMQHGQGTAVFVATDRPFDNHALTWPDNAVLAFRLLEVAGYREQAIFDESLNVSGTPKVVALLLDRPLRAFTLQTFALLAVFGWWRSRRFGPLLPQSIEARSDIVAHADAVGMLHYKTRDGRTALRYYLHQLTRQLKLKKLTGVRENRILEPIARSLGRSNEDVRKAFRQANAALKREKLDRASAAKHIRRLSKIRRAAARR